MERISPIMEKDDIVSSMHEEKDDLGVGGDEESLGSPVAMAEEEEDAGVGDADEEADDETKDENAGDVGDDEDEDDEDDDEIRPEEEDSEEGASGATGAAAGAGEGGILSQASYLLENLLSSPSIAQGKDGSAAAGSPELVDDEDDTDDEDSEEEFLEKFDQDVKRDVIAEYHNDLIQNNYDEMSALLKVVRDKEGNVIDPLHTTVPFLTKYEKARILGLRAKQINEGSQPFVRVPDHVMQGHIIAEMELKEKAIPFIVIRPLPGKRKEYWRLQDLEIIDY